MLVLYFEPTLNNNAFSTYPCGCKWHTAGSIRIEIYPYPKMYVNAYILARNPHGMCMAKNTAAFVKIAIQPGLVNLY